MTGRRARRYGTLLSVVLALFLTMVLAACSGEGDPGGEGTPSSFLERAAEREATQEAGDARSQSLFSRATPGPAEDGASSETDSTQTTGTPALAAGEPATPPRIAFELGIGRNAEIYVVNADGSNLTNLTNSPGKDSALSWSPDGSRIAFESDRDGNAEIYVVNADGSDPTNLTNNPAQDSAPLWSPDGSRIAFESDRDGNFEIYVVNADGSDPTNLTNNPAQDIWPFWSPDGSRIAYHSTRHYYSSENNENWGTDIRSWPDGYHSRLDIYLVNANGSGQVALTKNFRTYERFLSWSPDGSLIALSSRYPRRPTEFHVMNANGGLVWQSSIVPTNPQWPEDRHMIFASAGGGGIYEVNFDDEHPELSHLEHHIYSDLGMMALTPDRSALLYLDSPYGSNNVRDRTIDYTHLYMANVDGSDSTKLTAAGALDILYPTWSSDGRQIAFFARGYSDDKDDGIYVKDVDSYRKDEVQVFSGPARNLSWSPSGGVFSEVSAVIAATGSQGEGSRVDRDALVALYNATGGQNWNNYDNWSSEAPLGEWYGVTTDDNGRVVRLDLRSNWLEGEIPTELGILTSLEYLDLGFNGLKGEIPPELGGLSNLEFLSLSANQLTGEIPLELGSLANMTELYLTANRLSGEIPPELGGLANLTELSLSANRLSGEIPPELGNLTSLENLGFGANGLEGEIPPELGNLGNLKVLWLYGNQLSGEIPPELGNLANLEHLWLWENDLSGEIPPELGNLGNLRVLRFNGNQLSGEIPPELGSLSNLLELDLRDNQLSGEIPAELSNHVSLLSLDLSGNHRLMGSGGAETGKDTGLTGIAGEAVDPADRAALIALYNATGGPNWTNRDGWGSDAPLGDWYGVVTGEDGRVIEIRLPENGLSGGLPPQLGNLASLAVLDLDYNGLTGAIPPQLGNLAGLTVLRMGSNQLSGAVPTELGNLGSLSILGLGNNQLSGSIPPELGGLSSLTQISLWNNRLTGPIPAELGNLSGLTKLNLGKNRLSGPIPPSLGNLAGLEELSLGRNRLSGAIPAELGSLANLRLLYLNNQSPFRALEASPLSDGAQTFEDDGKYLHGEIPPELGRLENLKALDLSQNRLSGRIPWQLGNLTGLARLYLYDNKLVGQIPRQLANLKNLEHLSLSHNRLVGGIPRALGDLRGLSTLRLSNNLLIGLIPAELGSLDRLEVLDLSNNRLNGAIPEDLDLLDSLVTLDLGNNELTGNITIPREDAGTRSNWLPNLVTLNLSGNNLEGTIPFRLNRLASLVTLDLSRNQLEGVILEGLSSLTKLESLNLSDNRLSGWIPTWLSSHGNLVVLNIQGNPGLEAAFEQVQVNEDAIRRDRQALLDLFNATGGNNWKNNDNWNTSMPLSQWYGVIVAAGHDPSRPNRTGRVIGLSLTGNNLAGDISDWVNTLREDREGQQGDALYWLSGLELDVIPDEMAHQGDDLASMLLPILPNLVNLTATIHYSEVYRVSEEVLEGATPVIKAPISGANWTVKILKTVGVEGGRALAWTHNLLQTPLGRVATRASTVTTVVTAALETEFVTCVTVEALQATVGPRGVGHETDYGPCLREVDNIVGDAITSVVEPFVDIGEPVISWIKSLFD